MPIRIIHTPVIPSGETFDRERFRKEHPDPDLMRQLIEWFADESEGFLGKAIPWQSPS